MTLQIGRDAMPDDTKADKVDDAGTGGRGSGTAHRVLAMLTFLADNEGPVSVQRASEGLGMAASTTHRLLNLLKEEGFVTYVPASRSYEVGPQFQRVAAKISARTSIADLALHRARDIAARYDETTLFGVYLPRERAVSFAVRADGQKRLLYKVDMNTPLSLVWGASGKAILAFLDEDKVASILSDEGAAPATGAQRPALSVLREELRVIRRKGYAISDGEKLPHARGIAAPVFGPQGVIGSICLTSPRDRFRHDPDAVGREVAKAAKSLSDDLGSTKE